MMELNRRAIQLDSSQLVNAIREARERKQAVLADRDREYGEDRIKISSYLENIALPDIFGFDMRDSYRDPELAMDIELRHTLFWLDNSHDDGLGGLSANAEIMYYDMTLFGLVIDHQPNGVPTFRKHVLEDNPDLSNLVPFDFEKTGLMPTVLERHRAFARMSEERFNGELALSFPVFHRGPLDIAMQLRGYENFVDDTYNEPEFAHQLLSYIICERRRYNEATAALHNVKTDTTFIADDWLNVPFISPYVFEKYVLSIYEQIQENEGTLTGFHTCGVIDKIILKMLGTFPGIKSLEVSGWNDLTLLDRMIDSKIDFSFQMINTFVLFATEDEKRAKLKEIAGIAQHRKVSICVQSMIKAHDTIDESFMRFNAFMDMAREIFACY